MTYIGLLVLLYFLIKYQYLHKKINSNNHFLSRKKCLVLCFYLNLMRLYIALSRVLNVQTCTKRDGRRERRRCSTTASTVLIRVPHHLTLLPLYLLLQYVVLFEQIHHLLPQVENFIVFGIQLTLKWAKNFRMDTFREKK